MKRDDQSVEKINDDTSRLLIANCLYYVALTSTGSGTNKKWSYGCIKCKQGYNGTISNNGYILNCNLMSVREQKCSSELVDGLDLIWEYFYSCHKCDQSNKIPFLFIKGKAIDNPTPDLFTTFNLNSLNWRGTEDENRRNIECHEPIKSNFGY